MLTLITDAKPQGPHCQQASQSLQLPQLDALLRLLALGERTEDPQDSLSPLAEVLAAQALGLGTQDGLLPWAAWQAHQWGLTDAAPGPDGARTAWAWLSPCHWQVQSDHVRMADPRDCAISEEEAQTLMEAVRPYCAEDGVLLHRLHQGQWLASGAVFRDLPTASLARAGGGVVDTWMARQPQAAPLRRLQNEMQMLLYTHPVNDARSARGLLPINAFWVHGTGSLPAPLPAADATADTGAAQVRHDLREAMRRDDAPAWVAAWQQLDKTVFASLLARARAGQPLTLVLCGDRAAQHLHLAPPPSLWQRLTRRTAVADRATLLQSL